MACTCAPSLKALRDEANRHWPGRSVASDGCCASAQHTSQNPTSKHETGDAWDLTNDPARGLDSAHVADWMRLRCERGDEDRLGLIISAGRIATAWAKDGHPPWAWRKYTGSNPHTKHAHFELDVKDRARVRADTRPWFDGYGTPVEDNDMTDAERKQLADLVAFAKNAEGILAQLQSLIGNEVLPAVRALVTNGDALDVDALADRLLDKAAARLQG